MFIVSSSIEIISPEIVCSTVHLSICFSTRWLAGNCHKLYYYNWSVCTMGRMADILEKSLGSILNDGKIVLDEDLMMGILLGVHIS